MATQSTEKIHVLLDCHQIEALELLIYEHLRAIKHDRDGCQSEISHRLLDRFHGTLQLISHAIESAKFSSLSFRTRTTEQTPSEPIASS